MCSNIRCDVFGCKILESKQDDRRLSRRSAARSSDHSSLPRRCSHPAPVPNFSIDGDDLVGAACPSSRAEELSIDALSIYLILPKFLLPFLKIFFFCIPYIPFHYDFTIINLFIFSYIVAIRPFPIPGYAQ